MRSRDPGVCRKPRLRLGLLLCMGLAAVAVCAVARAQEAAPPGDAEKPDQADTPAAMSRAGWLPIPIFITEPAIGVGLGGALAYFHPRVEESGDQSTPSTPQTLGGTGAGQKRPPDVSGVSAAYTDTDTWFAGVGHSASWRRDRIRYAGALAYADINSAFYVADQELGFNLEGAFLYQDVKLRLGATDLFVGGKLFCMDSGNRFEVGQDQGAPQPAGEGDTRDVGLAVQGFFDARDNTFTPNRGQLFTVEVWQFAEALGGDFDYWRTNLRALTFHRLHPAFVLGLRLDGAVAGGDPPFYAYPWITLRGVPAMRYQNERVVVAEVEGRWNVLPRWALVGFFGKGATDGDTEFFDAADDVGAAGLGVRYLYLRELDLWVGVDVAWGPEESAWYIQVGHAW